MAGWFLFYGGLFFSLHLIQCLPVGIRLMPAVRFFFFFFFFFFFEAVACCTMSVKRSDSQGVFARCTGGDVLHVLAGIEQIYLFVF